MLGAKGDMPENGNVMTRADPPPPAFHYRRIIACCQLGMFIQAMVINLTPLLFIPLREEFGLTFEQIGRLVLINFITQMAVDLTCVTLHGRLPVKGLVVGANLLAALGLVVFALAPSRVANPYAGLVVGTMLFSTGCGLLEVLLSPLIHAVPSDRKSADMALLHAFYPIGKVMVILVTGIALWSAGAAWWPWITALWALVPLANTFAFAALRLPPLGAGDQNHSLRRLAGGRTLYFLLAAMMLAGAVEVTLAQWTSAYVQTKLGYPKLVADLVGFGLFGVGMIAGRLWFGLQEGHIDLPRVLRVSCWCSVIVCGVLALSPWPWVALIACVLSGGAVSMLWPGVLSMSAARFPLAGAGLFALLAAAGDGGAGLMPWLAGMVADAAQGGLRTAFLVLALCPAAFLLVLRALRRG
jgi:fucose permease